MKSFIVELPGTSGATLEVTLKSCVYDGTVQPPRPMVIIFPGGGYCMCSDREAEPVSIAFLEKGFHTCILRYSVRTSPADPGLGDTPMQQAAQAVSYVRACAEQWCVDVNKITVIGFSAGGHLAASLGVFWNNKCRIPNGGECCKPNAVILSYPVIYGAENTHRFSIENLTGISSESEMDRKYDLPRYVSSDTPPTFIWHTLEDDVVPVENSIGMAQALMHAKRPCAIHIFTKGKHGLSLATKDVGGGPVGVSRWFDLAIDWMENVGVR